MKKIIRANIDHFQRVLETESDLSKRAILCRLLAEQEAELTAIITITQKISFYSEALGRQLVGSYTVARGILTVFCDDGRKRETQARTTSLNPEYLARQMLIELERERAGLNIPVR